VQSVSACNVKKFDRAIQLLSWFLHDLFLAKSVGRITTVKKDFGEQAEYKSRPNRQRNTQSKTKTAGIPCRSTQNARCFIGGIRLG
jgi:hypothetical protein